MAIVVAVAFAVGTVGTPARSLGWTMALTTLALATVVSTCRRRSALAIGITAVAFVPWLAIRMSPWLLTVDLLMAAGLLIVSIALPANGPIRVPARRHLARVGRAVVRFGSGPSYLARSARPAGRTGRAMDLVRTWTASILVGLATMFAGLVVLASGDALLASFLDVGDAFGATAPRLLAGAIGVTLFALLLGGVAPPSEADHVHDATAPPPMPTLFGAAGLAAAIGLYAATQAGAAVLGAEFVERRTGLTYAEYARGGFFQLVFVSAIATAAVVVARAVVRRHPEMTVRLRVAAAALTVGVITTVVASVVKLVVYADTFGLTMLRLYAVVFACWLGVVGVLAFLALLRPHLDWLAPVVVATAVVGGFAMNFVNPERLVAEHDIARSRTTGELDVDYLSRLSLDAAPVVLDRLDDIDAVTASSSRFESTPADAADALRSEWCDRVAGSTSNDGLAVNAARSEALDIARSVCR